MTHEQQCLWPIVAKHFKIKKDKAQSKVLEFFETSGDGPVIEFDFRDLSSSHVSILAATSKATCRLGELLVFKQFKKSKLFSEVVDFLSMAIIDFVAFKIGSTVMAVSSCESYDGVGGLLVKGDNWSLAVEPVQNYLQRVYPVGGEAYD
jgi:hypothetical protein